MSHKLCSTLLLLAEITIRDLPSCVADRGGWKETTQVPSRTFWSSSFIGGTELGCLLLSLKISRNFFLMLTLSGN